jgi:hypothetical protein
MWPFSKKHHFPGVEQNSDGTINFSLTDDEAREADRALKMFEGLLVHRDAAEIITNKHVLDPLLTEKNGQIVVGATATAFLFIGAKPSEPFVGVAGVMGTPIRQIGFPKDNSEQVSSPPPTFRGRQPSGPFLQEPADIAFCKIDPKNCAPEALPLQPATVIDSKDVIEGTPAAILGFPQGLRFRRKANMAQLTSLLQTGVIAGILPFSGLPKPDSFVLDIYINAGSSGSPLFTIDGQVIGVVYATRQNFSPLVVFDEKGQNAKSRDTGVFLSAALGLAVPSARFFE